MDYSPIVLMSRNDTFLANMMVPARSPGFDVVVRDGRYFVKAQGSTYREATVWRAPREPETADA